MRTVSFAFRFISISFLQQEPNTPFVVFILSYLSTFLCPYIYTNTNITKQNKIAEQREENSLLKEENSKLKELLKAWQEFWKRILEFLQDKFFSSKKEDKIYEKVINELLDRNILNKDDIDEIQNGYYSNEKDNDGLEL